MSEVNQSGFYESDRLKVSEGSSLKDFLQGEFYPVAESRGFRRELLESPYITEFKRVSSGVTQVFEIQWHKNASSMFIINFGEKFSDKSRIDMEGRLQRNSGFGFGRYFGQHKPLGKKLLTFKWNYSPREVLEELNEAFDELEAWWDRKVVGPHLFLVCDSQRR